MNNDICPQTKLDYKTTKYYIKYFFINDIREPINEKELNNYINFCFDNEIDENENPSFKTEYHHIVPNFINNCKDSPIIKLKLVNHLYAHYLLSKVFAYEYKNIDYRASAMYSLNLMYNRTKKYLGENENIKNYIKNNFKNFIEYKNSISQINSYKYNTNRKTNSESIKGKNNGRYGKEVSKETRNKISIANKGRKWSEDRKRQQSEILKNSKNNCKGRIYVNNGIISKMIKPEEFKNFKKLGFVKGNLMNIQRYKNKAK